MVSDDQGGLRRQDEVIQEMLELVLPHLLRHDLRQDKK